MVLCMCLCVFYLTTLSVVKLIYQGCPQRGSRVDPRRDACIQVVCMHKRLAMKGLYSKQRRLIKQLKPNVLVG